MVTEDIERFAHGGENTQMGAAQQAENLKNKLISEDLEITKAGVSRIMRRGAKIEIAQWLNAVTLG